MSVVIPPQFAAHAAAAFGDRGREWVRALPDLVSQLADRWDLRIGEPFDLSYSYVAGAQRADGTEAVLKIGVPDDEALREILALRRYDGHGACRLLEADEEHRAMLLERLRPGETLVGLAQRDDEAATRVGAAVMRALWRPVPPGSGFEPIASWFDRAFARHRAYYGGAGPFPPGLLDHAEALAGDLLGSAEAQVLLHGDFHHYNVLSAERSPWLAIDPKGMIGDPGYEPAAFLRNPTERDLALTPQVLDRRLGVLAEELSYDRARLRDWGIAHAALSACWGAEDGRAGWERAIRVAQTLMEL